MADRPLLNYHTARSKEDTLPDASLLALIDGKEHKNIRKAVPDTKKPAKRNGLVDIYELNTRNDLCDHMNIFRTSISAGPSDNNLQRKFRLTPDAMLVKVRLRKYSQEQKEFVRECVNNLEAHGTTCPNSTSS